MANSKISALTALTTTAIGDLLPIVDISDTTQASTGTTKKITLINLLGGLSITNTGTIEITSPAAVQTDIQIRGSSLATVGGQVALIGGASAGSNGEGGHIAIEGGAGNGSGLGGLVNIQGGQGGATSVGGVLYITGGSGGVTSGAGGDVVIKSGAATNGGSNGGTLYIEGGAGNGAGTQGQIIIKRSLATAYSEADMLTGIAGAPIIYNSTPGGFAAIILDCLSSVSQQNCYAVIGAISENASSVETSMVFGTRNPSGSGVVAEHMRISSTGNIVLGKQSALATTATDGFSYIPTCAGAPTGIPTAYTGKVAMVFDTTNNKLMIYDSGWIGVTLS